MSEPAFPPHRVQLLQAQTPDQLLVHEIYLSVQGESTYSGLPCVFVRTTVCGQRCTWCDTPHAFTEGVWRSRDEVFAEILRFQRPLVEITGGEPLLQPPIFDLMRQLCDAGKQVLLETGGACPIDQVDPRVHVILDLKCPDSGECAGNLWSNLDILKPSDEIKFVLASRLDFDWASQAIRDRRLADRFQVMLSPVLGAIAPADLAAWLLESGLHVRMQIQLHKVIWDPRRRGV